jgi:hypothetical protein
MGRIDLLVQGAVLFQSQRLRHDGDPKSACGACRGIEALR